MLLFIHLKQHQAPLAIDHKINASPGPVTLAAEADGLLALKADADALEEARDSLLFLSLIHI